MALYNDLDGDHDVCISRYNRRTGNSYNVWVAVTSYSPAEATTRHDPGCESKVDDADAWTSMGCAIVLTHDELVDVTELYEQHLGNEAADNLAASEDYRY